MSGSTSITPTFRGEFYFLIAKFLEDGPCKEAAELLRKQITEKALVPPRFDWSGGSHVKTFRDIEEEFGFIAPEYLLKRCFELCSAIGDPKGPQIRSLVQKSVKSKRSLFRAGQLEGSVVHNIFKSSVGTVSPAKIWHERYLCSKIKYLRRNLGHLSSVYCLTFDRTGQIVITGADDSLVKCWSALDGRLIHTFRGSTSEIADMTVSHDNRLLAVGSNDKLIRVYDLQTAAPVAISSRHSSIITAVNFCPKTLSDNSFYLACTARDGCVSFWKYRYNDQNEVVFDETPTRYHERIRPGLAAIICASFSPGGNFFVVGSIDHHVRVYKMDCPDGPQRIFEDDAHTEGVDSVQWCNQPVMRFLSGSRDCTARIWTFSNNKWTSILLDMSLGDDSEKQMHKTSSTDPVPGTSTGITDGNRGGARVQASSQSLRPLRAAAAAAASTFAHANFSDEEFHAHQKANERLQAQQASSRPRVTMVAWTTDDKNVITAVSNFTLKIWKSCDGQLLTTLCGHKDEIYVLEPHPISVNILLTGAHDGQIRVWNLSTYECIYKHTNNVEHQQENSGEASHASVFDAKWSPDGTLISASDSHGQIIFLGHGSSERYDRLPTELFFHTDYRPLLRDSFHNVVDEQTQLPPHLMPPPFLVDSDGAPYPANIQRFAPGREGLSDQEALLPFGADAGPVAALDRQDQQNGPPLNQLEVPNVVQPQENIPIVGIEQAQIIDILRFQQQEVLLNTAQPNTGLNLVALANKKNKSVIEINQRRINELSNLETSYYSLHTQREAPSHNFVSKSRTIKQQKRNSHSLQNRSLPHPRPGANSRPRGQRRVVDEDDEEQGEENDDDDEEVDDNHDAHPARNNSGGEDTSDLSLSESDLSEESSTEETSEHSDWGSDHGGGRKSPAADLLSPTPNTKKRSPKMKKKRRAAQKCRELMQNGSIDNESFMPSPWLSDTIPRKSPYFPQIGDVLMYFKQGHENYVELVKQRSTYKINMREVQFLKKKSVPEFCLVKIVNIKVEIRPPRLVVLKLAIIDPETSNPIGDSFTIKYHDMNDVVDFLVLNQTYATIRGKHWKKGDRIRCQIDDCWWKGTIHKVEPYEGSRKSPFLAIYVHWDNSEKERLSPWDIEALDGDSSQLDDGTPVTPDQISSCLYVPTAEEWNGIGRDSECERISEALQAIMELAIAEPFNYPVDLTVYPEYVVEVEYPVDLSMVKSRVDNRFYRRIDAILFDLKYLHENAATFNLPRSDIVKNAKIIWQTASEIIKSPSKTKDDVSAVYHRMVETFEWSQPENSDSEEEDQEDENTDERPRKKFTKKQDLLNPKQWKRDCNDLLDDMFKHPLSDPFREPVSGIEYPDYQRIVSTPMDLTMVRESLHSGEYNTPTELQKDVQLIFKNSRTYNTNSKSKVWTMTTKLEEWFEKRMMKLLYEWRRTKRKISGGHNRIERSMVGRKPQGKSDSAKNRKHKNSESFGSSDKDDDSDNFSDEDDPVPSTSKGRREQNYNNPKPCSSRSIRQQSSFPSTSSEPGPSSRNDSFTSGIQTESIRRASSRPHRLPARLSDDLPSTSQGNYRGASYRNVAVQDDDDDEDDEEEQPLAVVRAKRQREEVGESSQGSRPKRLLKSKLAHAEMELENLTSEASEEESNDEREVKVKKGQKRKVDKEDPLPNKKMRPNEMSSEDDEDVPLSSLRRVPLRTTFSPQHAVPARPQRAAKNVKRNLAEQSDEDDENVALSSRLRRNGRVTIQREEEEEESDPAIPEKRKRAVMRKSQRLKSEESDEESSSEEDQSTEDESDDFEDEKYRKTSSRRTARGKKYASRSKANGSSTKHARDLTDDEDDEEENIDDDDDDEDDDDDNDLSPPAASKRSSLRRGAAKLASKKGRYGRLARQKNLNNYEDSDHDGSSERENRRPVRAAAQRNRFAPRTHSDESSYEDDEETGVVRKTKVTSRGRVCKPNPRII